MILDGQVLGLPLVSYRDTKTAIESLTGVLAGMTAYATDTLNIGHYTGSAWIWFTNTSGSYVPIIHDIAGAYHSTSGRTSGQILQATSATTFGWSNFTLTISGNSTINGSLVGDLAASGYAATLTKNFSYLASTGITETQPGSTQDVRLFDITPSNPYSENHGRFILEVNNTTWPTGSPTSIDPVLCFGYNSDSLGNHIVAGEHVFAWKIEADYLDPLGKHELEAYWQYANDNDTDVFRPLHFRVNDMATGANEWIFRGDAITFSRPSDVTPGDAAAVDYFLCTPQQFRVKGASTGDTGFVIEGAATNRRAHLYLGYNGVDTALELTPTSVTQSGWYDHGVIAMNFTSNIVGVTTGGIFLGVASPAGTVHIKSGHDAIYAGLFDARATQAVPILAWRDNGGNVLGGASKNGYIFTNKNTVPADAELAANQLMWWFDPTNGSAALNIKAKQADGTVVSGLKVGNFTATASQTGAYATTAIDLTLTSAHHWVTVTAAKTITLPAASTCTGRVYIITATVDGVIIDANASELINGELTQTLLQYDTAQLRCDGVGWYTT